MSPRTQKIEALRARLQQLEAAEKAAEARARAAASKQARADDTRRKILVGAFILDQLQLNEVRALEMRGTAFGVWLTRATDRALFGMASLPADGATAAPVGGTPPLPAEAR